MFITNQELINLLIKTGIADAKTMTSVAEYAKNSNLSLWDAIVEKNLLTDENLGLLVADSSKIPFIILSKIAIPQDLYHVVPERLARRHKIIAFARDQYGIRVATTNPKDTEVLTLIARKTGAKIYPYFATERDILGTLQYYRKDLQKSLDDLLGPPPKTGEKPRYDNVPIAKIVDTLIAYAYQDKASDVHIEVNEKNSLIRFRIDGVLHDTLLLPKGLHDRIVTRIKVLSRLRTDEHLSAQDGKMRIALEEENLDIRVSIVPIVEGEKVVLRLLSSRSRLFTLTDLGMRDPDLKKVERAFSKSFGMILSTGPTGSGKTTSIYAILKILNTREKNITTIEDPVEYRIKGVNQIQVNPKTNLTFAAGLRSILRQDPNIVFVGEIRDNETAGIAVNAALTGHLVLSTLHTNDAATTLPRLTDMDVEPFLVASTVNVIVAQRLIRKICDSCKTSVSLLLDDLEKNLPHHLVVKYAKGQEVRAYKGAGCKICHMSGYSGRVGLFEVLEITKDIRTLITAKADADKIRSEAIKEGMTTMLEDGLQKVIGGVTTVEEVLRVTKVESM